jgi:hypothetical protein
MVATGLLLAATHTASATIVTMDFEGVVADTSAQFMVTPYTENNLTLDSDTTDFTGIFGKDYTFEVDNTNGSAVFGWCDGGGNGLCTDSQHAFELTNDLGNFDLISMDAALGRTYAGVSNLVITGFYAGGGSIETTLNLSGVYNTFVLGAAWTGLDSVLLQSDCTLLNFGCDTLAIDNIVVNSVPIPAAVWLLGSALAGLGWLRRTK